MAEPEPASQSWLSDHPATARAERQALLYSPVWILVMGVVMLTGVHQRWSDPMFMAFGVALAAPFIVAPLLRPHESEADLPIWQRAWVRMNLYVVVLVWVGNYFVTHYFFELCGMRYGFATSWNLDSPLMGEGAHEVPLFLYPVTHAYFMSYHVAARALMRRARRGFNLGVAGRVVLLLVVSYAIAFAETFTMAVDLLSDVFSYASRRHMLLIGSLF